MIPVCFRFDDPSPTTDKNLERRIIEILSSYGAHACFAVVPFRISKSGEMSRWTEDLARDLIDAQQKGTIEIAQHGQFHKKISTTQSNSPSEFYGLPLDKQLDMIREGLEHLESIFGKTVDGFVPPWNTYDSATSQAVNALELGYISCDWTIYRAGKLPIIPRTCNLRNIRSAIDSARRFKSLEPAVVAVFHPDDFEEFSLPPDPGDAPPCTNLREFEELMNWIRSQPDLKFERLGRLARSSKSGRPLWALESYFWYSRLPPRIRKQIPKNILIQKNAITFLLKIAASIRFGT